MGHIPADFFQERVRYTLEVPPQLRGRAIEFIEEQGCTRYRWSGDALVMDCYANDENPLICLRALAQELAATSGRALLLCRHPIDAARITP